jgi:RimJ/RimL family protein N-acetyltransferase
VNLTLRSVNEEDLDLFFELQQDPLAVWMAAFTSAELASRPAFDIRWQRILADDSIVVKTVVVDGVSVGNVLKYVADGRPEVAFWIARQHWGHGYATEALRLLLSKILDRPVLAHAAEDNAGSIAVLVRNGFRITGHGSAPAAGRGEVVREVSLTLNH